MTCFLIPFAEPQGAMRAVDEFLRAPRDTSHSVHLAAVATTREPVMRTRRTLLAGLALTLSAGAWAATPMSYLRTFGPAGYPVTRLGWGLGIISISVVVIVGLLLLGGIFRRRGPRTLSDPNALAVRRDTPKRRAMPSTFSPRRCMSTIERSRCSAATLRAPPGSS